MVWSFLSSKEDLEVIKKEYKYIWRNNKMKRNSNTKKIVINALLLGIGAILHQITPALGIPMQPDFALAMLFIVMIINFGDYKTSLIAGIVTGIFTALTTKFPLGQVPNIIDKIVTVNLIYILMIFMKQFVKRGFEINNMKLSIIAIIFSLGTLISGTTFLVSAQILVGLPMNFGILFTTVVLPAVIINSIAGIFLFKIVVSSLKRIAI